MAMKRFMARILTGIPAVALLPTLALAHHSAAMFDMEKEVTLKGTVKDFQYTNPHSWLIVVARGADGKDVEWSFESEGPSSLLRAGIKKSSVQVGDKISMTTHPMKDGRPAGQWLVLTKADGTMLAPRGAPKPAGAPAS